MSSRAPYKRQAPEATSGPHPALIKSMREKAGDTQASAAKIVAVPLRTWQGWEQDKRDMPPAIFERYLLWYGFMEPQGHWTDLMRDTDPKHLQSLAPWPFRSC